MDQPRSLAHRDASPVDGARSRRRRDGWRPAAVATLLATAAMALLAVGCRATTTPDLTRVGRDVVDTLRAGREAQVVVALRLPDGTDAHSADPARRRAEIARLQADVLARLSPDHYRSRLLFADVPAMSGTVRTRAGLAALLAHPNVRRVDLDSGGTGSGVER